MKTFIFGVITALMLAAPASAQHNDGTHKDSGHGSGHGESASQSNSDGTEHRFSHDHEHASQDTTALLERLRDGGLVLYVRHERTDMTQGRIGGQTGEMDIENCLTQRNLSMAGLASAREVGENLRTLAVPVGRVMASPLCRTMDTARLMFGHADAEPALLGMGGREREEVRDDLIGLIAEHSGSERNTVFVAHVTNIQYVFGNILHEGDAAVLAMEDGEPSLLGTVPANAWNDLVLNQIRHGGGEHGKNGHSQTAHSKESHGSGH